MLCNLWCKPNLISIISPVSAAAWQRASGIRRRRWRLWLIYPIMTSVLYVPYVACVACVALAGNPALRAISQREIRSPVIRQTAPFNGHVHRHCRHVRSRLVALSRTAATPRTTSDRQRKPRPRKHGGKGGGRGGHMPPYFLDWGATRCSLPPHFFMRK